MAHFSAQASERPIGAGSSAKNDNRNNPQLKLDPDLRDFVSGCFGADYQDVWITATKTLPAQVGEWSGARAKEWRDAPLAVDDERNLYFAIGLMTPDATRRSVANVAGHWMVIADDIGTKASKADWEQMIAAGFPKPTFKIETSKGNETWGWVLDKPVMVGDAAEQDVVKVRSLIAAKGLSDAAVAVDPARYIRLPGGTNNKDKYKGEDGKFPQVWALELGLSRRATLEAMGQALAGADWREAPLPVELANGAKLNAMAQAGSLKRSADMNNPEPIMLMAQEIGLNPHQVRQGVVEAICPNAKNHTSVADTGFAFIGGGLMQCMHDHCQSLTSADFKRLICEEFEAQVSARVAIGLPTAAGSASEFLAREDFRRHGGLDDTAKVQAEARAMAARREDAMDPAENAGKLRNVLPTYVPKPVTAPAPSQIPPRKWLYGFLLIYGAISALVSPGGIGKSVLALVRAIAMATGRTLLAGESPVRQLRVFYFNAEDPMDEMRRRLGAALSHFQLTDADLGGRLFLETGRDLPLSLARMGRNGPERVAGVVHWFVDMLLTNKIDVLILDPVGAMHTLPENSNEAINLLMGALREIADRAGVAILLVHHTSKIAGADMDAAGAGAARGASAFVDAARIVEQVVPMTSKEAARFGISEEDRRDYIRIENGKANLTRAHEARWLRKLPIRLNNGAGLWPKGDTVATVESWIPPSAVTGTASELAVIQAAIVTARVRPRHDHRSTDWIGYLVADALCLDIGPRGLASKDRTARQANAFARIRAMVEHWIAEGCLRVVNDRDPQARRSFAYVEIGTPAVMSDPDQGSEIEDRA
ncbi:AAA family ATPase [Oricola nitratireducens]|uniref:AAA family ATPase n=1 Tax=Oricola nitratireducens TaxID=2775868 RepID=UPI001867E296|nr:AAA family ATPase [Oricola nitratireducens]